ncbi:MAG: hypothetical protein HW403_598, partial [Dehalococcoidia bacterium]|nr:hypothetical protein [Dehalococcoidia bacterium]
MVRGEMVERSPQTGQVETEVLEELRREVRRYSAREDDRQTADQPLPALRNLIAQMEARWSI